MIRVIVQNYWQEKCECRAHVVNKLSEQNRAKCKSLILTPAPLHSRKIKRSQQGRMYRTYSISFQHASLIDWRPVWTTNFVHWSRNSYWLMYTKTLGSRSSQGSKIRNTRSRLKSTASILDTKVFLEYFLYLFFYDFPICCSDLVCTAPTCSPFCGSPVCSRS